MPHIQGTALPPPIDLLDFQLLQEKVAGERRTPRDHQPLCQIITVVEAQI